MQFIIGPLIMKVNKFDHKTHFNSGHVHHVQVCKHGPDVGPFVKLLMIDGIRYCPPLLPQCLYQVIPVHWRVRTRLNSLAKMIPQVR